MKTVLTVMITFLAGVMPLQTTVWCAGDKRCPPPRDDGTYSAPYNALDHSHEYPDFPGADKPGWSCSYQREDGVIVQYGDSRTPQQQWLGVWGNSNSDNQ